MIPCVQRKVDYSSNRRLLYTYKIRWNSEIYTMNCNALMKPLQSTASLSWFNTGASGVWAITFKLHLREIYEKEKSLYFTV